MELTLTAHERAALATAASREVRVRRCRRFQALVLAADWDGPEAATSVGCSRAGVYSRVAAWRGAGLAGITEAAHVSPPPARTAPLAVLPTTRPRSKSQQYGHQATGWRVPLLHGEVRDAGIAASEATVRRAVRRLGWRWKRPRCRSASGAGREHGRAAL